MSNFITAEPALLEIATNAEGVIIIGGHSDNIDPERSGFQSDWFEFSGGDYTPNDTLTNITKVTTENSEQMVANFTVKNDQPFSVYLQTAGYLHANSDFFWGFIDNFNRVSAISFSGTPAGWGWSWNYQNVVLITPQPIPSPVVNSWKIYSDGANIFVVKDGVQVFNVGISADVTSMRFFFQMRRAGNIMHNVHINTSRVEEQINARTCTLTFVPPENIITRFNDDNSLVIKSTTSIDRSVTITHPSVTNPVGVLIHVSNLYIHPKIVLLVVQEFDIVQFESNAQGGILSATSGVIIDSEQLKWQAIERGNVTFTYNVNGDTATYSLLVIPKIHVTGVIDGYYEVPMMQGEQLQLISDIDTNYVIFKCVNFPNVITESGLIVAPTDAYDTVFGKKDLQIVLTAYSLEYAFIMEILPMFPTPEYSGVISESWLQKRKDYLPVSKKTTGGRKEARNENPLGVISWEIEYNNLRIEECVCGVGSCIHRFDASRLDAFYALVTTTDYFTVVDYHTREAFKFVTIEDYDNRHDIYRFDQQRSVKLYYDGGEVQL